MLIEADAIITATGKNYSPGVIRIEKDRIVQIGRQISCAGEKPLSFSSPGKMTIILPGLINSHCHLELSGLAGKIRLRKNQGLLPWLMKILIYRPKRKITQARWVKMGIDQSLASGTTTIADISANNQSWRTLAESPIRKICFAEVLGFGPKSNSAMDGLADRMADMPPEHLGFWKGVSPHAPYSTDERVYRAGLDKAWREGWRVTTHLAEDPAELEFIRTGQGPWRKVLRTLGLWDKTFKPEGLTPVAWAKARGFLDHPILLAHVNYADDQDIEILGKSQASVVYCPLAHRYFHHPAHRYRQMLQAGVNVVLGSDSLAGSESLSMLDAMREVYQAGGLSAETVLSMTTTGAAKSFGLSSLLGSLEIGKLGDLIILSVDRKHEKSPIAGVFDPEARIIAVFIGGERI